MTQHESRSDGSDLDPALQAAVSAARSVSVSDRVVERIEQRALATVSVAKRPNGVGQRKSRWLRNFVIPGSIVASALIAIALFWQPIPQASAWAEVVKAVAAEPWMRLTMQLPDIELPEGEELPEVVVWQDGDRETIASIMPDGRYWVDLASSEMFCFDARTGRIRIGKPEDKKGEFLRSLLTVLDQFDASVTSVGESPAGFVASGTDEVTIDGQTFDEFSFRFDDGRADTSWSMVVLVDRETSHPTWLTIDRGEKSRIQILDFAIDYPNSGPADIYALGVPRDAPVDDMRALAE